MIIPTLVLVTAMQFGDPQSGQRIDDLSHSPWREMPTVNTVSLSTQSSDTPEIPIGPIVNPSMSGIPNSSQPTFSLGAPNPDLQDDNGAGRPPFPPWEGNVPPLHVTVPTQTQLPTRIQQQYQMPPSANGSYIPSASSATVSQMTFSGSTRVENDKVYLTRAVVEFDKLAKLSTPVDGIVVEQSVVRCDAQGNVMRDSSGNPRMIDLQRGVRLFTGQQIVQLDTRIADSQLETALTKLNLANMEAAQTIAIVYAKAAMDTAKSDWDRNYGISEKVPGAVTDAELELKWLQYVQAFLSLKKAEIEHLIQQESVKVQEEEVKYAKTQIDLRKVKTPFDGIVVNVFSEVGNSLKPGDIIAEVAQLDKLKVLASVDGKQVTQEQVDGKRATIIVTDAPGGQSEQFDGFVRYAAPIFNMLRQFDVEIEVDNRLVNGSWLLKRGDYVDVVIHL